MRIASLIVGALCAVFLCVVLIGWRSFLGFVGSPAGTAEAEVTVTIPEGIQADQLAAILEQNGLLTNREWFLAYMHDFRAPTEIIPGEYKLTALMNPAEIVDVLRQGHVVTYTVTIEPGLRATEVATRLAAANLASESALRPLLTDPAAAAQLGVLEPRLEGYLFPDAYDLPHQMLPIDVLRAMVKRFSKAVTAEIIEDAKTSGLSLHDLVVLASLIEADKIRVDERPMVSSVFHNRLSRGMKLESRPSVAYGLDKPIDDLMDSDFKQETDWNTFLKPGLPLTPICNPSLESIVAAARPAKSDALYVAPRGEDAHTFCPDLDCYKFAVEKWREQKKQAAP